MIYDFSGFYPEDINRFHTGNISVELQCYKNSLKLKYNFYFWKKIFHKKNKLRFSVLIIIILLAFLCGNNFVFPEVQCAGEAKAK